MDTDKHFTTSGTIGRALRASLDLRHGVQTGLTWGGFKAAMFVLGVNDEDHLASIEFGVTTGTGRICRDDAPDGIEIREARG